MSASAIVAGRRATVGVRVTLPFPAQLSAVTRGVQGHVTARTHALTGLHIPPVRVVVSRLAPHGIPLPQSAADADTGSQVRSPRRWWSQRRGPTSLVLALTAAATIVCTADVLRVHVCGEWPGQWRLTALRWLAGHGPGDPTVTSAAVGAMLVGAWLVVLALTPGNRRQLMLAASRDGWCAQIDRSAVAALIRDAVGEVPGLHHITVRCGRRTVKVRGEVAFGDCASARDQARQTVTDTVAACGLVRPVRLRLALRPADAWQALAGADKDIAPRNGPSTTQEDA
ncbi:DUF6286 domain-containing protein [Streptomyces sp. VRA16 Mangrove soil]|uniref:DUF6286 domain-containing protein n=1 Tax=Streptomyces sp. VRA16 Mangrove soil TaxID=2817434 RepID=UPI001A9F4A92|nr:DUF6286 domain-containing protein [Streptomyces sp. VRA16 Mangrove soil]MBO1337952.1 Asp23/Gls24 family envelope stress response protein [Streptomyces sp. VRA16 Mangrove soil]